MKDLESAEKLSREMIEIGKLANRETVCILTNMEEPLGYAVGNSLEIIEAIKFLKGEMIEDVKQVVLELGAYMVKLAGLGEDLSINKMRLLENIQNGKAYNKFIELVENQGGDISYIEDIEKFEKAKIIEPIYSPKEGYVQEINAKDIGKIACNLGAGRVKKEDKIEKNVGILLNKKVGDIVKQNEVLAYIHSNDKEKFEIAKKKLEEVFIITPNKVERMKTIINVIK